MNKKLALLVILLTVFVFSGYNQKQKTVLKAPKTWISEIIPFPINFAPSIPYVGFEDLRFAPNWSDSTHSNFWTYMFVWYVFKDEPLTESKLEEYFSAYYDGLMRIEFRNKTEFINDPLKPTTCSFTKTEEGYDGVMHVFDGFFSKEPMILNMKVTEQFCPKRNRQIIRCNISPQVFSHEVWQLFDEVQLKVKCK